MNPTHEIALILDSQADRGGDEYEFRRFDEEENAAMVSESFAQIRSQRSRETTFCPGQAVHGRIEVLVHHASINYRTLTLVCLRDLQPISTQTLFCLPLLWGVHTFEFEFECPWGSHERDDHGNNYDSNYRVEAQLTGAPLESVARDSIAFRLVVPEGAQPHIRPVSVEFKRSRFSRSLVGRGIKSLQAKVRQVAPRTLVLDLQLAGDHLHGLDVALVYGKSCAEGRIVSEPGRALIRGKKSISEHREFELPDFDEQTWWSTGGLKWYIRVKAEFDGSLPTYVHEIPISIDPAVPIPEGADAPPPKVEPLPQHPTWVHALVRTGHGRGRDLLGGWMLGVFFVAMMIAPSLHEGAWLSPQAAGWWTFALGIGVPICVALFSLSRGEGLRSNLRSLLHSGGE